MQDDINNILQKYWGFSQLKPAQTKAVNAILDHHDVCCYLPTGSGKSICFQLPALQMPGICVVISPLIALMEDQSKDLSAKGIANVVLKSKMPFHEIQRVLDNCQHGNTQLLYLSPERFQSSFIQERLQHINISFFAIDEAHCISQWGNDFRPSFRKLYQIRDLFPHTPIMALTASATTDVKKDIQQQLRLEHPLVIVESVIRPNIRIGVININDRRNKLIQILKKQSVPSIIYVRSRKLTLELNDFLRRNDINSEAFNAGLPLSKRQNVQNDFLNDRVDVIIATTAFGMGINKKNIRRIIHFDLPESIESYYQEIGRAGRDHQPAKAITFYNLSEINRLKKQHIEQIPDIDLVANVFKKLHNYYQIAYHDGKDETFNLDIIAFAKRYRFGAKKVLSTLRILEKVELIELKTNYQLQVEMKMSVSAYKVNNINARKPVKKVLNSVLRNYPGVFEQFMGVDLTLLSQKNQLDHKTIINSLKHLSDINLAEVKIHDKDFMIRFLSNYEGESMILRNQKIIKQYISYKKKQVQDMINFIQTTDDCYQQLIAMYFGERNPDSCGMCYVCKRQKGHTEKGLSITDIENEMISILSEAPQHPHTLLDALDTSKTRNIMIIRNLLSEDKLKINSKNQLEIHEK
ncbi:MAG: RecQ family ATP-dependent DNA helicase [Psychroflexus sp.]|nr:RecQ family ATP-dependent DNA helicase [Psychroflexus sp.]